MRLGRTGSSTRESLRRVRFKAVTALVRPNGFVTTSVLSRRAG